MSSLLGFRCSLPARFASFVALVCAVGSVAAGASAPATPSGDPASRAPATAASASPTPAFGRSKAQPPTAADPSQWRGFNLLEKFTLRGNARFREEDFRWIAELGFNFVRLPLDYRCYTAANDWLAFDEKALAEIDEAIAFGRRHGVHVCLNLHRAPGFCINPPAEPRDLWTDPVAEAAFVAHWTMFARRYRGIPSRELSFNLLNEPLRNTRESFLRVHRHGIEAIHAIDPERLVIVDGNQAGRDPFVELIPLDPVVQATRGYHPASISHFRASWMQGSDRWPVPTWPPTQLAGHLYGPAKPDLQSTLTLTGPFAAGTHISLRIAQLSSRVRLRVSADGRVVSDTRFDPKSEPDQWRAQPTAATYVLHEPVGERMLRVELPGSVREVSIDATEGDWIRFDAIVVTLPGAPALLTPADPSWGRRQSSHPVARDGRVLPPAGSTPDRVLREYLQPWRDLQGRGATVFVGEWGCYNRTPHAVTLAWMESWLRLWDDANVGWALWNFRGAFGILDSGRADVTYEDWHGHKLDRAMLTLLQRHRATPTPAR